MKKITSAIAWSLLVIAVVILGKLFDPIGKFPPDALDIILFFIAQAMVLGICAWAMPNENKYRSVTKGG